MSLNLSETAFLGSLTSVSTIPAYVQDVLDRITAADVAAGNSLGLQNGVVTAITDYLTGMVSAGYLGVSNNVISQAASTIKFLPLLFCARTIQGALVPVVGPTPTRSGQDAGWNYSQRNGLSGNGTNNFLNTNYNNSLDAQNSKIASIVTTAETTSGVGSLINGRATGSNAGQTQLYMFASNMSCNVHPSTDTSFTGGSRAVGFYAVARTASTQFILNSNGANTTIASVSGPPSSYNLYILARNDAGTANQFAASGTRVILPAIGGYIDPAALRSRQLNFRDAVWAAI